MSKYTPGPWRQSEDHSVLAFDGGDIILIAEPSREAGHNYKANAALIAAAPEMLQALKVARDIVVSYLGVAPRSIHGKLCLQLADIDVAIAKAEGRAK